MSNEHDGRVRWANNAASHSWPEQMRVYDTKEDAVAHEDEQFIEQVHIFTDSQLAARDEAQQEKVAREAFEAGRMQHFEGDGMFASDEWVFTNPDFPEWWAQRKGKV